MLAFRSEAHLSSWLERGHPAGESLTFPQQWLLARRWFEGRHRPAWRPRTPAEAQEVFASVGLTSDFWALD